MSGAEATQRRSDKATKGNRSLALAALLGIGLLATTGCLAPSGPRGVTAWLVGGDEELTFDTLPSLENELYSAARRELHLHAALNETIAVQLALRSTNPPAGPFDVHVSELVGNRDRLPPDAVTLARVHYVRVEHFRSWYPAQTGRSATPRLFPDVLVPWDALRGGGPLLLAEPRNEIVWVEIRVPPTVSPGEYHARLEVRGVGVPLPVLTCDVQLDVLPVALPGRRSLPVVCRVDPRDLLTTNFRWFREPAEETRLLPEVPSHLAAVQLVRQTMLLLEAHRTNPVLWACFPKFRPLTNPPAGAASPEPQIDVQWDDYDRLVGPWLDGTAFPDRMRLDFWPLPVSADYPSPARSGGLDSPAYTRLLTAYLRACQQHFADRGWSDRAFTRLVPPQPLTQGSVDLVRRLGAIEVEGRLTTPALVHLPARSLRGLGWHAAPTIDPPDVDIWAPPAMWFEPPVMADQRQRGRQTWFMPDSPPFGGSLAVEAGASDTRILPWLAYRYGAGGIWIENAADLTPVTPESAAEQPWCTPGLVYSGEPYGLRDRPLPSLRLKRLQRGLQDYELLRLLEDNGKKLLAQNLASQVVRWAFTDACEDSLLSTKDCGWPRKPGILRLARTLMLQELAGEFEPNPAARQQQIENLSQWGLLMTQARHVVATVDGVRLMVAEQGLQAHLTGSVLNATNRGLRGRWLLPAPPPDWRLVGEVVSSLEPGTRRPLGFDLQLGGLAYNVDGAYPFELAFDTDALGTFRVPARLAVAVCPPLSSSPLLDGRLTDWPLASNNAAGDFRLCRRASADGGANPQKPALPTQAFFGLDAEQLYVAIRCTLRPGEPAIWLADNTIPIDGAQPWGQDVVEVLIDPRATPASTSSDLYCVQIKPSGLLVARRGCRSEPPIGDSRTWSCGARVAVSVQADVWVVELAIPLAAFDADARHNRVWGVNVTRLDARRGEYSSWSGARGHCYNPQSLGNLIVLWP
jgi:hypothetical protein